MMYLFVQESLFNYFFTCHTQLVGVKKSEQRLIRETFGNERTAGGDGGEKLLSHCADIFAVRQNAARNRLV